MKDRDIKSFFAEHKAIVDDNGFSDRLYNAISCLPEPKEERLSRPFPIWQFLFTLLGTILFVLLGGYDVVLQGMLEVDGALSGSSKVTPELIIAGLAVFSFLFAIGRYALKDS